MKEEYDRIRRIIITRQQQGYSLELDRETIQLPEVTNFEWRTTTSFPVKHLYLGNESLTDSHSFNLDFEIPCRVSVSVAGPRCYLKIEPTQ